MEYTDKELDLAYKFSTGEYTETQFNYLIFHNNFDKEKMYNLVEYLQSVKPVFMVARLLLLFLFFYVLACLCGFYLNYIF